MITAEMIQQDGSMKRRKIENSDEIEKPEIRPMKICTLASFEDTLYKLVWKRNDFVFQVFYLEGFIKISRWTGFSKQVTSKIKFPDEFKLSLPLSTTYLSFKIISCFSHRNEKTEFLISTESGYVELLTLTPLGIIDSIGQLFIPMNDDGEVVTTISTLGNHIWIIGTSFGRIIVIDKDSSGVLNYSILPREKLSFLGLFKTINQYVLGHVTEESLENKTLQKIFILYPYATTDQLSPFTSQNTVTEGTRKVTENDYDNDHIQDHSILLSIGNITTIWYNWSSVPHIYYKDILLKSILFDDLKSIHSSLSHRYEILDCVILSQFTQNDLYSHGSNSIYYVSPNDTSLMIAVLSIVSDQSRVTVTSERDIHTYLWLHIVEIQSYTSSTNLTTTIRNRFLLSKNIPITSRFTPRLYTTYDSYVHILWSDNLSRQKNNGDESDNNSSSSNSNSGEHRYHYSDSGLDPMMTSSTTTTTSTSASHSGYDTNDSDISPYLYSTSTASELTPNSTVCTLKWVKIHMMNLATFILSSISSSASSTVTTTTTTPNTKKGTHFQEVYEVSNTQLVDTMIYTTTCEMKNGLSYLSLITTDGSLIEMYISESLMNHQPIDRLIPPHVPTIVPTIFDEMAVLQEIQVKIIEMTDKKVLLESNMSRLKLLCPQVSKDKLGDTLKDISKSIAMKSSSGQHWSSTSTTTTTTTSLLGTTTTTTNESRKKSRLGEDGSSNSSTLSQSTLDTTGSQYQLVHRFMDNKLKSHTTFMTILYELDLIDDTILSTQSSYHPLASNSSNNISPSTTANTNTTSTTATTTNRRKTTRTDLTNTHTTEKDNNNNNNWILIVYAQHQLICHNYHLCQAIHMNFQQVYPTLTSLPSSTTAPSSTTTTCNSNIALISPKGKGNTSATNKSLIFQQKDAIVSDMTTSTTTIGAGGNMMNNTILLDRITNFPTYPSLPPPPTTTTMGITVNPSQINNIQTTIEIEAYMKLCYQQALILMNQSMEYTVHHIWQYKPADYQYKGLSIIDVYFSNTDRAADIYTAIAHIITSIYTDFTTTTTTTTTTGTTPASDVLSERLHLIPGILGILLSLLHTLQAVTTTTTSQGSHHINTSFILDMTPMTSSTIVSSDRIRSSIYQILTILHTLLSPINTTTTSSSTAKSGSINRYITKYDSSNSSSSSSSSNSSNYKESIAHILELLHENTFLGERIKAFLSIYLESYILENKALKTLLPTTETSDEIRLGVYSEQVDNWIVKYRYAKEISINMLLVTRHINHAFHTSMYYTYAPGIMQAYHVALHQDTEAVHHTTRTPTSAESSSSLAFIDSNMYDYIQGKNRIQSNMMWSEIKRYLSLNHFKYGTDDRCIGQYILEWFDNYGNTRYIFELKAIIPYEFNAFLQTRPQYAWKNSISNGHYNEASTSLLQHINTENTIKTQLMENDLSVSVSNRISYIETLYSLAKLTSYLADTNPHDVTKTTSKHTSSILSSSHIITKPTSKPDDHNQKLTGAQHTSQSLLVDKSKQALSSHQLNYMTMSKSMKESCRGLFLIQAQYKLNEVKPMIIKQMSQESVGIITVLSITKLLEEYILLCNEEIMFDTYHTLKITSVMDKPHNVLQRRTARQQELMTLQAYSTQSIPIHTLYPEYIELNKHKALYLTKSDDWSFLMSQYDPILSYYLLTTLVLWNECYTTATITDTSTDMLIVGSNIETTGGKVNETGGPLMSQLQSQLIHIWCMSIYVNFTIWSLLIHQVYTTLSTTHVSALTDDELESCMKQSCFYDLISTVYDEIFKQHSLCTLIWPTSRLQTTPSATDKHSTVLDLIVNEITQSFLKHGMNDKTYDTNTLKISIMKLISSILSMFES